MNKPKYYLIHDNSTEWFSYIVEEDGNKVRQMIELKFESYGDFIRAICEREWHFSDKVFENGHYYGWSISKFEFERIKRLTELYHYHKEYLKLLDLP